MKTWFEIDVGGLRELQLGKPKHYVARELIQNALDENTTKCQVTAKQIAGLVELSVEDDNPAGFVNLADAFTLFGKTSKRKDPEKRGRYNLGEKQSFSICEKAIVETTKGTIVFDDNGRHKSSKCRLAGSKITVWFKATNQEFEELLREVKSYLAPEKISFIVNGEAVKYKAPFKVIEATLQTEIEQDDVLRKTNRKTKVFIHKKNGAARIFEMGLPVQEIDCDYDLDVQQKIPLGIDRETVSAAFLQDLYAEVLNNTFEEVNEENASALWVRTATSDERIRKDAVSTVLTKRFGEKFVSSNPFDKNSIDDALSHGYKVISGSEMSGEEWSNAKNFGLISSSSDLFGHNFAAAEKVNELTPSQEKFKKLALKIARACLKKDISVEFVRLPHGIAAQYGDSTLTVNLSSVRASLFDDFKESINLILHELGHENGNHTEAAYHELLTRMAAQLIEIALKNPEFFEVD
jgi:hypothetical protein